MTLTWCHENVELEDLKLKLEFNLNFFINTNLNTNLYLSNENHNMRYMVEFRAIRSMRRISLPYTYILTRVIVF